MVDACRPVKLEIEVESYRQNGNDWAFDKVLDAKVGEVMARYNPRFKPTLVFTNTRKGCFTSAAAFLNGNQSARLIMDLQHRHQLQGLAGSIQVRLFRFRTMVLLFTESRIRLLLTTLYWLLLRCPPSPGERSMAGPPNRRPGGPGHRGPPRRARPGGPPDDREQLPERQTPAALYDLDAGAWGEPAGLPRHRQEHPAVPAGWARRVQ